jgi:hypothetical protein
MIPEIKSCRRYCLPPSQILIVPTGYWLLEYDFLGVWYSVKSNSCSSINQCACFWFRVYEILSSFFLQHGRDSKEFMVTNFIISLNRVEQRVM